MWRAHLALALAVAVLTSACQPSKAAPTPRELRVGIAGVSSLDPLAVSVGEQSAAESLVIRQVYEGLTDYDPVTLRVVPALAKSWTVSPDARTFTFTLRKASFHNERRVEASDVTYSLVRLATASCGSALAATAGAPSYLLSMVEGADTACNDEGVRGITAEGPSTVTIKLKEPFAELPAVLTNPAASIVPRERVEFFNRRPMGSGPYRVVNAWDGRRLVVERFDDYWGARPAIRRVRFVGYPTDGANYRDLADRKLHIGRVPSNRLGQARRQFGARGLRRIAGSYFFAFNLSSRRLEQRRLREGLLRAVDRASLASAVFEQTREPARGLAPPEVPGADGSSCAAACVLSRPDARSLIADVRPGGAPEIVIGVSSAGANPAVGEALAGMFGRAGVTARVLERPFRDHVRGLGSGDADLFQLGWVPAYPSLDGLLVPFFRTGGSENHLGYSNPQVDALLDTARRTLDARQRAALYGRAERLIVADAAVMPLSWYRSSYAFDRRLHGRRDPMMVDGMGHVRLALLRWAA